MATTILKIEKKDGEEFSVPEGFVGYGLWSTVVDAPITLLFVDADNLARVYGHRFGEFLDEAIDQAQEKGIWSVRWDSPEAMMEFNRYGENEECLSIEKVKRKWFSESLATYSQSRINFSYKQVQYPLKKVHPCP